MSQICRRLSQSPHHRHRPRRRGASPAFLLVPALGLTALGCGQELESPTGPESTSPFATAAAQPSFRQVSAGAEHTCAVTPDDVAYCWGHNISGQLGDGTTTDHPTPVAVAGGLRFAQVSAGVLYTCGLTTDSRVFCWGENSGGQLGDGTTNGRRVPVPVAGGRRYSQVRAGYFHTCAITVFDIALCWGSNTNGQLGDGTRTDRLAPVTVHAGGLRFHRVSPGGRHTCAVTTDFRPFCWGKNEDGQLGDGTTIQKFRPVAVLGGHSFRQVIAGGAGYQGWHSMSCGLTSDSRLYCWGENVYGQLGDGTTAQRNKPVAIGGVLRFVQVGSSGINTCGATQDNQIYCWGNNNSGQLGDGTFSGHSTPGVVAGGLPFRGVTTGFFNTCGVTTADRVYCWGDNAFGGLGDGTTTNRPSPVAVVGAM